MQVERRSKDNKSEIKISSRVFTYICLIGLAIGVITGWLMFVQGFFPLRVSVDDVNNGIKQHHRKTTAKSVDVSYNPPFDKLVFVVFDALRSDFITDPSSQVCFPSLFRKAHYLFFFFHVFSSFLL